MYSIMLVYHSFTMMLSANVCAAHAQPTVILLLLALVRLCKHQAANLRRYLIIVTVVLHGLSCSDNYNH